MMKKVLGLIAMAILLNVNAAVSQLKITEIRVRSNDTSTDTDYIEISGSPGSTIPANTRIVAFSKGGGTDAGVVSGRVQSIAGLTIPDDGYLSICRNSTVITNIDHVEAGINWQSFQNLTFLIVEHSSFIGSTTDVDANDDGVIDNAFWTSIIDGVSLRARTNATIIADEEQATRAWDYSQDAVFTGGLPVIEGKVGSSTLHHIQRNPLTDAWEVGDSTGSYSDLIYDSHGNANSLVVNPGETVVVNEDLQVYNVIVKGGGVLSVAAGMTLEVLNNITNNGTFTLESGSSLLETTGSFTGNALTIKRTTQHAGDLKRHNFVGSPVSSFNIEGLNANSYYTYNEPTDTWSILTGNPVMEAGQGYSVVGKTDLVFSGIPNTGTIAVNATADAFKLVANPYPCAINTDQFFLENTSNLSESTIWLWNDGGSESSQRATSDYMTINSLGAVQSGGTGSKSSTNFIDKSIGSMQGFLVKTSLSGTSVSFSNDMKKSGDNDDAAFFRTTSALIQKVKLTMSNEHYFSQVLMAFAEDATTGIDKAYDATKVEGSSALHLSSIIDDQDFAIIGNPTLNGDTFMSTLSYTAKESGVYALALSDLENIPDNYTITLMDHLENVSHVLTDERSFTFHSEAVSDSKRFSIVFSSEILLNTSNQFEKSLAVYATSNGITIFSDRQNASISLYDIQGKTIYTQPNAYFSNNTVKLNLHLTKDRLYFLRVNNDVVKFIPNH